MWNYQTIPTANLSSVPKTILVKGDTGGFFTGEEGRDDTEALYPGSPACGRKAIDTKNTSMHDGKDFTLRHRLAKAPHKWLLLCLLAVVHICFSSQSSRSFIHIMNNAGFSFAPLGEHLATTTNVGGSYAVAHYVESLDQLYGIYSIHKQLNKHNMLLNENNTVSQLPRGYAKHVVVVPRRIDEAYRNALVSWLGEDNVRTIDEGVISGLLKNDQELWQGVFNKLWLFNLTEFDKLIILDADILIRTNIMHWYDYATPCAIEAKDDIDWNGGAMVIKPDAKVFQQMLSQLPKLQSYPLYRKSDDYRERRYENDPLTGGHGSQAFLTAFFVNNTKQGRERCVMPTEAAVLSSTLEHEGGQFDYYSKFRPWIYQTVHFTVHKPWRNKMETNNPTICKLLREWNESMTGIEDYYNTIPPLQNDYLKSCAPTLQTTATESSLLINGTEDNICEQASYDTCCSQSDDRSYAVQYYICKKLGCERSKCHKKKALNPWKNDGHKTSKKSKKYSSHRKSSRPAFQSSK